jgi:SPP1 gp7 family putative phage head morphogenesis protein
MASKLTDAYVKHALQLIRVSNGLQADSNALVRILGQRIKKLLAGEDLATMKLGRLRSLLKEVDKLIYDTLGRVDALHDHAVTSLIKTEANWAVKIGKYDAKATDTAIARAIGNFTVVGNTVADKTAVLGQQISNSIESQIRLGATAGQTDKEIIERILGPAGGSVGGVMEQFRKQMRGLADSVTQSAADTGRRLSMAANGVNALQWSAKLDTHVCPSCGERDGKIWTIDGEPVGHSIVWMPAPLHPWCRCLAIPLDIPGDMIDQAAEDSSQNFSDWLDTLDKTEQDDVLGHGRADMWRSGDITLSDLIGQNGLVLSLTQLESMVDEP